MGRPGSTVGVASGGGDGRHVFRAQPPLLWRGWMAPFGALGGRRFCAAPGCRHRCRFRRLLQPLPAAPGRPLMGGAGQPVFGGRCGSPILAPRRAAAAAAGGCCGRCQQPLGGRWGGARGSPFLAVAAGQRFWRRAGLPPPLPLRAAAAAAASGPWAAGGGGRAAARFWRALRVRVFGAAPGSRRRCRWLLLPLPVAPGRPVGGSAGQPIFGGRCGSAFLGPRRAAAAAAATGGCRGHRRQLLMSLPAA